ncbi:MAG: pilus assembly protein [Alphaproteobacteria bacterium]|nr:pilus assembly protein [Alphaproteobacteria bacterium]
MIKSICSFLNHYKNNKNGVVSIEFALVAIPFLLLIFGVMEAGRLVWTMNGVQYAIEETGRYASLNSDTLNENLQDYAKEKLLDMFVSATPLQVTSSIVMSNGVDFVQIDGNYTHTTMLDGILPGNFGNFDFDTNVKKPVIQ